LTNRIDRYGNPICPVCELPLLKPYTCPFVGEQRVHLEMLGLALSAERPRGTAEVRLTRV
jgi:hypothetical protein